MKTPEPTSVARKERSGFTRVVEHAQRAELGDLIRAARLERGWSRTTLARAATRHLAAFEDAERYGIHRVVVLRGVVTYLENGLNTAPLGNAERRAKLLGIALALDLDRAEVNLLAGGV
jgi:hypothetical protein